MTAAIIAHDADSDTDDLYEASPIRRSRASRAEMEARHDRLVELAEEHQPCSVRHLFYRAVVDQMPGIGKDIRGYAKVQRAVLALRRAGRIPYSWIVDNSRAAFRLDLWSDTSDFLEDMAGLYRRDLWDRSPHRIEVWCESDSIAGTLLDVTSRWRVPLYPIRGQSSETFVYNAVESWLAEPARQPVVLYVGDHDPAGMEIERALASKMRAFSEGNLDEEPDFLRLAVTWRQVEEFDLPGTTPKKEYEFPLAVEAEALPPHVLRGLVDDAIAAYVDPDELQALLTVERAERASLKEFAEAFTS